MIATGTDVKPLECLMFMRNIRSLRYFEQMKGRGCRVIDPDVLAKRHARRQDIKRTSSSSMRSAYAKTRRPPPNRLIASHPCPLDKILNLVAAGAADADRGIDPGFTTGPARSGN